MTAGVLSPAIAKEVRALLPAWAGALAIVVLARAGHGVEPGAPAFLFLAAGPLGFALGSIVLGALSFGHEYTQRTMTLLLSQPVDRRRLLAGKLGVLVATIGSLLIATAFLFRDILNGGPQLTSFAFLGLAAVSGLFIAPWVTILSRSPLAGVVFAIGIPGLMATLSDLVAGMVHGLAHPAALDRLSARIYWSSLVVICGVAAAGTWRGFLRLEVIDGADAELQLPGAALGRSPAGAAARRPVSPLRALVGKELRLQQMIFVIALLFTVVWSTAAWYERLTSAHAPLPLLPMTVFYASALALLAGSLTIAQERQLGMLDWQTLQPVAAWQQWLVKIGVAWTLVLTFGVALPLALAFLFQSDAHLEELRASPAVAGMLTLTTAGIYLSSLSRTSITALVSSVPSILAFILYFRLITDYVAIPILQNRRSVPWTSESLVLVAAPGLIALLVWLAFLNQRRFEGVARRLVAQVPAIAAYVAAAVLLVGLLGG